MKSKQQKQYEALMRKRESLEVTIKVWKDAHLSLDYGIRMAAANGDSSAIRKVNYVIECLRRVELSAIEAKCNIQGTPLELFDCYELKKYHTWENFVGFDKNGLPLYNIRLDKLQPDK